jgi:transketolase
MTWRLGDHCGSYLADRADSMSSLWVLDGDLADSDGAEHFADRHPDRFLMAGIAEQSMVSVAAGMAHSGLRPWVFSFAAFLCYRAFDQIRVCVSQAHQPVVLVGSHSGGRAGRNGKTHAAVNDLALLLSLPHVQVWSPADKKDVGFCVDSILHDGEPAYIRLPRCPVESIQGSASNVRWFGGAGPHLMVSTGLATHSAIEIQARLAARGHQVRLAHVLRLAPLPRELMTIVGSAQIVFVLEDHSIFGGLASLLMQYTSARVISFGWPMTWPGESGQDQELLLKHGLDSHTLCDRIEHVLTPS